MGCAEAGTFPRMHVVWDWNGTLFDDQHLVLEGLHAVLDDAGLPRVDLSTYQRLYTRPVEVFYERLFGRRIPADEWAHLDEVYHRAYRTALHRAGLAEDAHDALELVAQDGGASQSLLSMWRHDELVPLVDRLGIVDRFLRVDGVRGKGGGRKAPYLRSHLEAVASSTAGRDALVVGDALDDAAAAEDVGVPCVLFDGGSHPRTELEQAGVPVAGTLVEALEIGRELTSG
jgi:phosphoglycolate phosphatase-like HAD superfamily hydrolase